MEPLFSKTNQDKLKQHAITTAKAAGRDMVDSVNPMIAYRKKVSKLKKQQTQLNECVAIARKITDPVKRQAYLIERYSRKQLNVTKRLLLY